MPHPTRQNIWAIIPGYNEEKYLARVLRQVRKYVPNIIYVDDGSRDTSVEIAKLDASYVLRHRVNLGKGGALKTGCEFAFQRLGASAVILLDADEQHSPRELPKFLRELRKGRQMIFGTRAVDWQMPLVRTIGNRIASVLVYYLFGRYIPDIPSGFKAFSRSAYEKIIWTVSGYEVEMEIAVRVAKNQIPFVTVPIQTIYHDHAKGMTLLDVLKMIGHVFNWRFSV